MTAAGESELLTVEEAAALLRISSRSLRRTVENDTCVVPVFRPTPRRVLFSRVMIERYLATGQPVRVTA